MFYRTHISISVYNNIIHLYIKDLNGTDGDKMIGHTFVTNYIRKNI